VEIAWVDLETTGLHPEQGDEIIEAAVIITDEHLRELSRWHAYVTPSERAVARMDACEDNFVRRVVGFDEGLWRVRGSISQEAAAGLLRRMVGGRRGAGHCWSVFDIRFLRCLFDVDAALGTHRPLDTASLAYDYVRRGWIKNAGLGRLCRYLGVSLERAHAADCDIEATVECARRLLGVTPCH